MFIANTLKVSPGTPTPVISVILVVPEFQVYCCPCTNSTPFKNALTSAGSIDPGTSCQVSNSYSLLLSNVNVLVNPAFKISLPTLITVLNDKGF